jgi:hypothetical protein
MPRRNPRTDRLEVSVCRSSGLSEQQVWAICTEHFDTHAAFPAIGRGVGPASAVYAESLGFDAGRRPLSGTREHHRMARGAGKPDNELKSYWIYHAQRMASKFKCMPRSPVQDAR